MEPALFFGIPLDPSLEKALGRANPALLALFFSGEPYLEKLQTSQGIAIGKWISPLIAFEELENIGSNILSFLRRLAPQQSIQKDFILYPQLIITQMN